MKERPIIFNGPMVQAILAGRKTQTRRVVKTQPSRRANLVSMEDGEARFCEGEHPKHHHCEEYDEPAFCPYGKPGDRLWVREKFKPVASGQVRDGYGEVRYGWAYESDGVVAWDLGTTKIYDLTNQPPTGHMQFRTTPWKPSIHMPRRASRITLEITAVRVERLQDITEEDAKAQGLMFHESTGGCPNWAAPDAGEWQTNPRQAFRELWESIRRPGSWDGWDANPWVWAVEFKRVDQEVSA